MEIKTNNKQPRKMGQRFFKWKALIFPMLVISCGGHTKKDRDLPVAETPVAQSTNESSNEAATNDANKSSDRPVSFPLENKPTPTDSERGSKRDLAVKQKWRFKTIIREFDSFNGKPDRAALFIIATEPGHLDNMVITGSDLGSSYRAVYGDLEKLIESPAGLFKQSAFPMNDTERQNLLAEYKGATVVYLEQYQNALCDGSSKSYHIKGDVLGTPAKVDISFQAFAQEASDCLMARLVEMASMKN